MKRKFLSAVLFGVMAIASTSTFVSCKDYDDDINSNRTDITALQKQVTTLQTALAAAQADATTALANAATAQKAAEAAQATADKAVASAAAAQKAAEAAQATGDQALAAAKAAQATADAAKAAAATAQAAANAADAKAQLALAAAAQAKVDAINAAQKMVDSLATVMDSKLGAKVDTATYNKAINEIGSKIDAIDESLNQLGTKLTTETNARIAADADLQSQIDALKKFQALIESYKLDEFMTKTNKSITDLNTKIDKVNTDLSALITKLQGVDADLQNQITAIKNSLSTTDGKVAALEAWQTEAKTAISNAQKDIEQLKTDVASKTTLAEVKQVMEQADKALKATLEGEISAVVANLNTLNIFVKQTLTSLVFKPAFYYGGIQAMEAAYINYNNIKLDAYTTLTKTGETYTTAQDVSTTTPEVTAEYHMNPSSAFLSDATLSKLSFVSKDLDYVAIGGTRAETAACAPKAGKGTFENGILRVPVTLDASKVAKDESHVTVMALQVPIMIGAKDTTITSDYAALCSSNMSGLVIADTTKTLAVEDNPCTLEKFHVYKTAAAAIEGTWTHQLEYSNKAGIDMKTIVATHFKRNSLADEKLMEKVENYGLEYQFAMVGYLNAVDGKTNESSYAKMNGSVIEPAYPDSVEAIYHQPLVRVTLVDKATKNIVAIGYVKFQIVRVTTGLGPQNPVYADDGKNVYLGCNSYTKGVTYTQIESSIASVISKQEFEANYTLQLVANSDNVCQQYTPSTTKKVYTTATAVGTITVANKTLTWTLTEEELYKIYVTNKQTSASATVLFKSNNPDVRPDVFVTFKLGQINLPTAVLPNTSKISNYWFAGSSENAGFDEIHNHVEVYGQTNANCEFNNDINSTMVGNWPALTIADGFTYFTKDKLTYEYQFVTPNPATVKGVSGTVYTMSISADGTTLYATSGSVKQAVAVISKKAGDLESGMNSIVAFQKTTFAEDLLNITGHKDLANTFTAKVGLFAYNTECRIPLPITGNTFDIKFLRPINVDGNNSKSFTDAVDGVQKVAIKDLITFTDWRDYGFTIPYFEYYGVKSVIPLTDDVLTNMNQADAKTFVKLSTITKDVKLSNDAAAVTPGSTNFGYISYENNGNAISGFTLRIPLKVTYNWGTMNAYVDIPVAKTVNQVRAK